MPVDPACQRFLPLLSPYVDGELAPKERVMLEQHLTGCVTCPGRVADFRAESGLIRHGLDLLADEVDFSKFSQQVMARITPVRPPLFERFKVNLSEMWTYQRGPMVGGLAMAAALLVAIPVVSTQLAHPPEAATTAVNSVTTDEQAHVAPVVLKSGSDSIVWLVDHGSQSGSADGGTGLKATLSTGNGTERPQGGEL